MRQRKGDEPSARAIQLLLSYAVRYPEIATVRYDPAHQSLRLSFLVKGALPDAEFERASARLRESLEVYLLINEREAQFVEVSREALGEVNSVSVERDVQSFTPEEIYTVVEVVRSLFPSRVIAEPIEFFGEDDLLAQHEMIEEVLASLSSQRSQRNLIAIREEGRLMIFQK